MVKNSESTSYRSSLKKGAWSSEEDRKLINYIKKYKIWNWSEMSKAAGLARSGKSCRLRWVNYLRPDIKHGNFSHEEVQTIMILHETLGNRWASIASKLPGRTDNEVKNYWHTHLKKRLNKHFSPKPIKETFNDQNASPNTLPELVKHEEHEEEEESQEKLDDEPADTKSTTNITESPQPMSIDDTHISSTANKQVLEADHNGNEEVLNLMAQDNYSVFFEPDSAMSNLWTYDQYYYEEALSNNWLDLTDQIF